MKCVVANAQLGTWCRAIHALTQVGDDDIYFDFTNDVLTVSTANTSHTAFATFLFFKSFFANYRMANAEPEKVAIPAKIILKPYRTQKVAKSYLSSEIDYNAADDFLTVTSEGKSHVLTTYKLGASSNSDSIEFDSDPNSRSHCLTADAKVLSSCLSNFGHVKGLTEINLKIQGQKIILRNCVTDIARKDGSVVTEYNLTSYDFIDYEVPEDFAINISFGFREFKTFTTFAEQLKLPISIHFQEQEDPVIITVKSDVFEARLCMATRIRDPSDENQNTCSQAQSSGTNGRISSVTSQSSTGSAISSRSLSVEKNRRDKGSNLGNEVSDPEPPSKRPRRTEAPPPVVASSSSVHLPNEAHDEAEPMDTDSGPVVIEALVQRMEGRNKSKAYKTIQRVVTGPTFTEKEYLNTLPGNDVVLCPDSDEED